MGQAAVEEACAQLQNQIDVITRNLTDVDYLEVLEDTEQHCNLLRALKLEEVGAS